MEKAKILVHEPPSVSPSAAAFRGIEKAFKDGLDQKKQDQAAEMALARKATVTAMIDGTMSDADWDASVDDARKAAGRGEKQWMLLRFPSDLCTDDSRAINNPPNAAWPETLRGEAADVYRRWHTSLRPLGFDLSAQVLDFPGGKPGDVGLFLRWGG